MSKIEYLESIIEEANEALASATAGGNREYAFDLWVHDGELCTALELLRDLNYHIADEL